MLSVATSRSWFLENSTGWKFTKVLRFSRSLSSFLSILSLYSSPLVKSPSKVHGWGKWKIFSRQVCIHSPAQTGTIVCCMCCIWDNISCCTLAIIMSWCDGVIIPSLSISLWMQKQRCAQTQKATPRSIQKINLGREFPFFNHQNWQTISSKGT